MMSSKKNRREKLRLDEEKRQLAARQSAAVTDDDSPSIAQLVLQRLDKTGTINKLVPSIKVMQADQKPSPVAQPANWPQCPDTISPIEWRRALENKEYYELRQMEDGDKAKPWFQYPRHAYQYSEFVYLTPVMAQELLGHNPVNRNMKHPHSAAIARDVKNQRWLQTAESISINTLGNMHDGQHRSKGLIDSGVEGWPFYITWNVPPEAIYVIDSGDVRRVNERLNLLFPDSKISNKMAAICRSMMWGLTARGTRYSETEIAEFAVKHEKVISWAATELRGLRADLQAVIAKSVLWWGEDKIAPFVNRLKKVEFRGEGDPAKALYLWLQLAKTEGRKKSYANPLIYYKKTLAAIHAHAEGRDTKKIYAKQNDVFEWEAGWCVPKEAPSAAG